MKTFIMKFVLALGLAVFLVWGYLYMPNVFFSLDKRLRDFMFVLRGELPKSENVVIVDIDEKALKRYGQWPWSRDLFAKLIYNLTDAGAGIIGLDIVFAEEDRTSPAKLAKKFSQLKGRLPDYDKELARCFENTPVIGGYIFLFQDRKNAATKQEAPNIPAVFIQKGITKETPILRPKSVIRNIPVLQNAFYSSGFFNNTPDEGGMIRSVPLVMQYDGVIYPSLALEMIRVLTNEQVVKVVGTPEGVQRIEFKNFSIPTDQAGRLIVNFRGPAKHFRYISAADVIANDFNKSAVEGKFVLVGTSAVGLFDLRSIPFDSTIPGVEVHANAIDNILSGDFIQKPVDGVVYDIGIIVAVVLVLTLLFSFIKSIYTFPVALAAGYALYKFFYVMLFEHGLELNLLFPLLAFILSIVLSVGFDYFIASRQKEEVKRLLGKKVSPAVMEYLIEHSQQDLVTSKDVEATVFFSDIRGFTTISEKLGSPHKVINLLNDYMTPMVEIIVNHKGTIDKFIGDAIMAYWNAPLPVRNHADEAVTSALEQIEKLESIDESIEKRYGLRIAIGIGIHTGIVTAGDMGSEGRSDYTIIGDNVNLASRMEGLTKVYGAQILISKATKEMLTKEYTLIPLDLVEVKGKSEAVEIFEVIHKYKKISPAEIEHYTEATELFRKGEVEKAHTIYTELYKSNKQKLFAFFIERCERFINDPSLEFTPILKMTTK